MSRVKIKGSRVAVTGAGSGIGKATAVRFARLGAEVVCVDIDGEAAQATAEECGGGASARTCDVSDAAAVHELAESIESEQGPVDVLVNNAGVGIGGPFLDASVADWDWLIGMIEGVINAATATTGNLWCDLTPLIDALPAESHRTAAVIAGRLPSDRLVAIVRDATDAPDALPPLASLVAAMDDAGKRNIGKVIQTVAAEDPHTLRQIVDLATRDVLWTELAPLVGALPYETQTAVAGIVARVAPAQLTHLLQGAARAPQTLPILVTLLEQMPEEGQAMVAVAVERAPKAVVRDLLNGLESQPGAHLTARLPKVIRAAASRSATTTEQR